MSGSSNARVNAIESPPSTTKARSTSVASSRPMTSGGNGCSLGPGMRHREQTALAASTTLAPPPRHRRVEVIEPVLHQPCRDFGADTVLLPAFFYRDSAAGLLHRGH